MEIYLRKSLIVLLSSLGLISASAQSIKSFPLDDHTVYHLKIATDKVTTLMFPEPITALQGADITVDPKVKAPLLLDYQPGEKFFSVRAQTSSAQGALNVISNRKIYVLEFTVDPEPFQAVRFYLAVDSNTPLVKQVGPNRLLGLLDQAKAFQLLAAQYPEMVSQIDHAEPFTSIGYRDFNVVLDQVFRFEAEDALIFHIDLINLTNHPIAYLPQSFAVRVGTNVYTAALADASGTIPAGTRSGKTILPGQSTAWFVICGTSSGERNHLSVHNPFNILVFRPQPPSSL